MGTVRPKSYRRAKRDISHLTKMNMREQIVSHTKINFKWIKEIKARYSHLRAFSIFQLPWLIPWEDSGREEGNPALNLRVSLLRQNPSSFSSLANKLRLGNNIIFYDLWTVVTFNWFFSFQVASSISSAYHVLS